MKNFNCAGIGFKIRTYILLQRYLTYSTERSSQSIFKAQEEGRQVTRIIVVVDSDGVNLRQQGCPLCN